MSLQLLALDPDNYSTHPLHALDRTWAETNCYVDLWIEVLHALDLDPLAAAAFTLECDFEGDQWTFFKFPPEDLRLLFGVEVSEMNVWRPVLDHVAEQLGQGCLVTVEVDAWFLPDTASVTYHSAHAKTTIVPQMLDSKGRRMGYFHNSGYFELDGGDFDGIFRLEGGADELGISGWVPPPYMERVRLDRIRRDPDPTSKVVELVREHLSRRPQTNPMVRFAKRLAEDIEWLASEDLETFHLYAFGTCRQCGASAEMAASFVDWLDARDGGGLTVASEHLRTISTSAKALELALSRVVRGREVDLGGPLGRMESSWEAAMGVLVAKYRS